VGWLNYFPQETNVDFWADIINHWIATNFPSEAGKAPTKIGLEYCAIFDGTGLEARKRMTDKERWAKKAVHVVCKRGEKLRVTTMIRAFLKSKRFLYMCHLPSRLIPILPRAHSAIFQAKYQEATLKHMKLTHYGTGNFTTFDFTSPDKKCNFLDGGSATIRSLILRIYARGTTRPLFLALNPATKPQEKGGFVVTYCKAYESEAVEKIANIASFFQHHYGDESLERFTPEACEQADNTKWDEKNDRPITMDEQDLQEVMEEDIAWIENLNDVTFGEKLDMEVIVERPKKAPNINTRAAARPTSTDNDTVGTFFPGQQTATTQLRNDEDSDALTTDTNISTPAHADDKDREACPTFEASVAGDSSKSSADGV
jgi:hypothetical protein